MKKLSKVLKQIRKVNTMGIFCWKRTQIVSNYSGTVLSFHLWYQDEIPLIDLSKSHGGLLSNKPMAESGNVDQKIFSLWDCPLYVLDKGKKVGA